MDSLLTVSQLARITKENYEPIARASMLPAIRRLLTHSDAGVRARVCNLLGNLCRHSGYFYNSLEKHGLIQPLIDRCRDQDRATRKFACFAIGNAGFHNNSLYEPLRSSIAPLVALLRDEEDKTRANAAGALGNLVRNHSLLCRELVQADALQVCNGSTPLMATLLRLPSPLGCPGGLLGLHSAALSDPRRPSPSPGLFSPRAQALIDTINQPETAASASEGGSPLKIALFSLGNMCAHRECREALLANASFSSSIERLTGSKDETVKKYVARIKTKLSSGR